MGRQQVVRGNPESKQYFLVNDFSGGINIADVDERMQDNEFRALLNVELSLRGMIQNRKGWGNLTLFNALLSDKGLSLPNENIALVYLVRNEGNFLREIERYTSLAEFRASVQDYELQILIVSGTYGLENSLSWGDVSGPFTTIPSGLSYQLYQSFSGTFGPSGVYEDAQDYFDTYFSFGDSVEGTVGLLKNEWYDVTPHTDYYHCSVEGSGNKTNFYLLKMKRTGGVDGDHTLSRVFQLTGGYNGSMVTNVDVAEYREQLYIPLNQVTSGYRKGLVIFDIKQGSVRLVDGEENNTYIPNPYEVKNVGFNVLLGNPLTVGGLESSVVSIVSMYLTSTTNEPLFKIPTSGKFIVNLIYTGTINFEDWIYEFYTLDSEGNRVIINSNTTLLEQTTNTIKLSVNLGIGNQESVFISIRDDEYLPYDAAFSSLSAMKTHFNKYTTGKLIAVDAVGSSYGGYTIYEKQSTPYLYNTHATYGVKALPLFVGGIFNGDTTYTYFYTPNPDGTINIVVRQVVSSGGVLYQYPKIIVPSVTVQPVLNDVIPNIGFIYKAGADYYNYNGGTAGTSADFTTTTSTLTEYEYTDNYLIGEEKSAPIESLIDADLTEMRLLNYRDRLLIYFKNTIWLSDKFNFEYMPSYNFINFDLNENDSIQSINYYRGSFMVFTKERIYRLSGEFGSGDFSVTLINDAIGCYARNSVRAVNNTLLFIAKDGLYKLKQNFYQGGLENVEKVDTHIKGLFPIDTDTESFIYNEQAMWLFKNNESFDVLKLYYNMTAPNGLPFTIDQYQTKPTNIAKLDFGLYSIKNGKLYKYDLGYTDFLSPTGVGGVYVAADYQAAMYPFMFMTPNFDFYYPTHEKKYKNFIIKTNAHRAIPLRISVYIDDVLVLTSKKLKSVVNEDGSITYTNLDYANYETDDIYVVNPDFVIGKFILGETTIGEVPTQIHKIPLGFKGRNMAVQIYQGGYDESLGLDKQIAEYFGIQDFGYNYKLGKVRENR